MEPEQSSITVQVARRMAELHLRRPDMAGPDCQCATCKPGDYPVTREEVETFLQREGSSS